jgi:hypothetical protein
MKITFEIVFKVLVLLLLVFITAEIFILKKEMNENLNEVNMVISKLDYVESDINSPK